MSNISLATKPREVRITYGALALWGAAAICTSVLIFIGVSPTGTWWSDTVLVGGLTALVLWVCRAAPWWAIAIAAVVPLALAPIGPGTGLAMVAIIAAALAPKLARTRPLPQYAALCLLMWALAQMRPLEPRGLSTLVACVVLVGLAALALPQTPSEERRAIRRVLLFTFNALAVILVLTVLLALWARSDVERGQASIEGGLEAASDANLNRTKRSLVDAQHDFERAHLKLSNPVTWLARIVPVVGQNLRAGSVMTAATADFTEDIIGTIDAATDVTISNATIELNTVDALVEETQTLPSSVRRFRTIAGGVKDPWLAGSLADAITEMEQVIDRRTPTIERYATSARMLPAFLGANKKRHYFVMFTTPAEARGTGGFMGNFAEITIDKGKIELSRFGRVNDLEQAMRPNARLEHAPKDWLRRYRQWAFVTGDDDKLSRDAWAIVNLSPHFPSTARVIREMYRKSQGAPLDGVFSMDVYGLQSLVELVGPIEIDGGPRLTGKNTAKFLLIDQYEEADANSTARVDMLSTIADEVITRVLEEDPPSPISLGAQFAPLARQRRFLAWAPNKQEQAVFADLGMAGRLLDKRHRMRNGAPRPGFQLILNNGAGNKIDSFLRRKITIDGTSVTISLTNTAPSSGLPNYVIGNAGDFSDPPGTNIANLTIYATEPISKIAVNGEELLVRKGKEAGMFTYDLRESIPSGQSITVTFTTTSPGNVSVLQPLAYAVDQPPPRITQ